LTSFTTTLFTLLGGTKAPRVASTSTTSPGNSRVPPTTPPRPGAVWVVKRLFVHFQHLAKYFGVPDDEIPRNGPTTNEGMYEKRRRCEQT
jgi:hypothetical protein